MAGEQIFFFAYKKNIFAPLKEGQAMGVPLDALGLQARQEVEAAVQDLILETKCPICLDFFTNPRSAPCQHNFCEVWRGRRARLRRGAARVGATQARSLFMPRCALSVNYSLCVDARWSPAHARARACAYVRASGSAGVYMGVYQRLA